jgi:hypothetical protein
MPPRPPAISNSSTENWPHADPLRRLGDHLANRPVALAEIVPTWAISSEDCAFLAWRTMSFDDGGRRDVDVSSRWDARRRRLDVADQQVAWRLRNRHELRRRLQESFHWGALGPVGSSGQLLGMEKQF